MPRELHPENLNRITSSEQAREMQKRSAQKRSQNIKERKTLQQRILERVSEDDFDAMIDNLAKRAKKYDRSFETLRDTIGEMPTKPVQISQEEPFKIEIETLHEDTKNG